MMLFKTVLVLYSFVVLASTRECEPGQHCLLRCCRIPKGDLLCRERCLGLSCDKDVHCDGDCCVNSTCSSCPLKSISSTDSSPVHSSVSLNPQHPLTTSIKTTDVAEITSDTREMDQEDKKKVTTKTSPTKRVKMNECSRFDNKCLSNCCIDGKCVDISQCVPVKAARGGRGGGGGGFGGRGGRSFRRGRSRGGFSGCRSRSSSLPAWVIILIVVGAIQLPFCA